MAFYERRLPHWDLIGQPLFVTFRLHGSLPKSRVFPPNTLSSGAAFVAMDRLLDLAEAGPRWLANAGAAEIVENALWDGQKTLLRYELHAFVVMPNHVHMLATGRVAAATWLRSLKGFTASKANQALGLTGPFWQHESYDHLVRNTAEFERIRAYIENNPVRAGLAVSSEQFRWSSAWRGVE